MDKSKQIKVSEAIKEIRKSVKGKKLKFSEIKLGQVSKKKEISA